ncbi:hypothetical protein FOZ60_011902 [Perkinsus olseni]|uniref:Uncharacterized protein n=1 Tax=Perkinsus olseni TaxID=32597 RepID=A0A7J6NF56_PEROL|nr:hypothetical protein FOZ60_011902 [Perkinsus olseni]
MSTDGLKRASTAADKESRFKLIVERNPLVRELLKKVRREILQLRMQQNRQRASVEARFPSEMPKPEFLDTESITQQIRGYLEAMLCCRLRQHMRMEHSKRVWVPRNMLESRSESGSQEQSMPYSGTVETFDSKVLSRMEQHSLAFRFWAFGEIDEFEEKLERFTDSWLRSEFGLIGILELIVHRIQELSHLPPRSCSDVSVLAKIVEIELLGWAAKQDWQIAEIQRRKGEESGDCMSLLTQIHGDRGDLAASECDETVDHA